MPRPLKSKHNKVRKKFKHNTKTIFDNDKKSIRLLNNYKTSSAKSMHVGQIWYETIPYLQVATIKGHEHDSRYIKLYIYMDLLQASWRYICT